MTDNVTRLDAELKACVNAWYDDERRDLNGWGNVLDFLPFAARRLDMRGVKTKERCAEIVLRHRERAYTSFGYELCDAILAELEAAERGEAGGSTE